MTPAKRHDLEVRWLELTRVTLPSLASGRGWPIRADHCFQRVLLDQACGGCWYDVIAGRPAYRTASDEVLASAVALGDTIASGNIDLPALNRQWLDRRRAVRGSRAAPG